MTAMIEKYIIKKLAYISISQSAKDACLHHLDKIANRYRNSALKCTKKELTVKCCFKFIKMAQNLFKQESRTDGLALLEFTKSLLVQIYDTDKIQINLIKIRIYLVLLKWQQKQDGSNKALVNPKQQIKENKLFNKILLFLSQIKRNQCFGFIIKDYYSHIDRLYLEAIKFNLQSKKIKQCQQFVVLCFEALQSQIQTLCNQMNIQTISFTPQQNKILNIVHAKIQLLHALYKLQYSLLIQQSYNHESILEIIVEKYQILLDKVPNKYNTAEELQKMNVNLKKQHVQQQRIRRASDHKTPSVYINANINEHQSIKKINFKTVKRQSIRASIQFMKQFMDIDNLLSLAKSITKTQPSDKIISASSLSDSQSNIHQRVSKNVPRQSTIFKLCHNKENNAQQNNCSVKQEIQNRTDKKLSTLMGSKQESREKRPKTFSLVDRIQKMKKQKLKTLNPFNIKQSSKKLSLSVSNKQMITNGVFFHFSKPTIFPISSNQHKLSTHI